MVAEAVNLILWLDVRVNNAALGTVLLIKKATQTKSWHINLYKA